MMRIARAICLSLAVIAIPSTYVPAIAAGTTCEGLATLSLPQATITAAQTVSAGSFQPPTPARGAAAAATTQLYAKLPSFCRVSATLTPSSDSDIKIEVWLPMATGWNGKLQAVGNGGWA